MDKLKCKGCQNSFFINGIKQHINKTQCKLKYSTEDYENLTKLCESHVKMKISERKAKKYQEKKNIGDVISKCNICDYKGSISNLHQHIKENDDCYKKYPPEKLLEIHDRMKESEKKANKYQEKKSQENTRDDTILNCNICDYKGNISDLHQHIMKKDDCYKKYPPSDLLEIEKQFNSGKTEKRKISNATYYKKRKSQKALQDVDPSLPSSYDSQEKIQPSFPSTSGAEDFVTKFIGHKLSMDIFSHGCKVVLEHFDLDKQVEFYGRLSEKNSDLSKLNNSINDILKFPKDPYDRINILVSVKNGMLDYICNHADEVKIWWDIWAEELRKAKAKFSNFKDVEDDIFDMQLHLTDYNDEIFQELLGEINNTMNPYRPDDDDQAKSVAEKINKKLLLENVRSLLHYIIFSQQNVFDYIVQYAISLSKHIKKQLIENVDFPILECLIEPVPKEFEIGWTDLDSAICNHYESEMEKLLKFKITRSEAASGLSLTSVICKGCPNNPKKFNEATILKHLKNKANAACLVLYTDEEIHDMESTSKQENEVAIWDWQNKKYGPIREKREKSRPKNEEAIYDLSEDLAAIVGLKKATETIVVKKVWVYIKKKKLLDKPWVNADYDLLKVIGEKKIKSIEMSKYLRKHMILYKSDHEESPSSHDDDDD